MTKITIIGAGVVGAAIAYELSALPELEITLVDEKKPATGATGAALGVLMGIISHKTKGRAWQLRRDSLKRYETLIPELESLTGLRIPCNEHGIVLLRFADEDEHSWQKLVKIRQEQGFTLEIWDRQTLQQKCPEVTIPELQSAIYSPCDRQIDPTLLTHALVEAAASRGVNCLFGVKVENLANSDLKDSKISHCDRIYLGKEPLETDFLILCAGIGVTPLTSHLAAPIDVRPVLGQALQIKLSPSTEAFQPVVTGKDVHIVPVGRGEYWIGATVEFMGERGEIIPEKQLLEEVYQQAIAFCSTLAAGEIVRTWSGLRPRPENKSAPVIEYLPNYDNVILATGHYRNGVLLAPATAKIVREMIVGTLPNH